MTEFDGGGEDCPLGDLRIADLIGGVGDLKGRTLADVTQTSISVVDAPTSMTRRVAVAWASPFEALTCEQVRLLLGQDMGVCWLGTMAFQLLRRFPLAEISFFPGDLAITVLRNFDALFQSDPVAAGAFLAGDFSWITGLHGIDGADAENAERLLAAAHKIAAEPITPPPASRRLQVHRHQL